MHRSSTHGQAAASRDLNTTSLQHIELLMRKRQRLEEAQLEAEEQFCFRIAQQFRQGEVRLDDLIETYVTYRSVALPGYSKRWNAVVPIPSARLMQIGAWPKPNGDDGCYIGEWPIEDDAPYPRNGMTCVYLLFDLDNVPCYVGSTGSFRARLKAHWRDGKQFRHWRAVLTANREAAYQLEDQWLRSFKPYLNRRAGR